MAFMSWIVERLNATSGYFYSLYLETYSWVYPFWLVSGWFYQLSTAFSSLAWNFSDFGTWVNQVVYELTQILSWDTIWSYILSYVPNLEEVRDWFYSWWSNVYGVVDSWWTITGNTVQGWIAAAVAGANQLIAEWNTFINSTWVELLSIVNTSSTNWNDFINTTLPGLVDYSGLITWWNDRLGDIDLLINDKMIIWFPFRDDLVRLWDSIVEFFTDPLSWLEGRFTNWFLGPEV